MRNEEKQQILELAVCKAKQHYIKESELYRSSITKAITNKEPIEEILLNALKCISVLTSDNVFYTVNERNLKSYK